MGIDKESLKYIAQHVGAAVSLAVFAALYWYHQRRGEVKGDK